MSQLLVARPGRYYTYAINCYPPAQPLNSVRDLSLHDPTASTGL